jgi:hypothetical protein
MKAFYRLRTGVVLSAGLVVIALAAWSCNLDIGDNFIETGTIVHLSFEGGFYGIQGDDGRNYDPTNLPAEFRKEGMRVRFEAKELKDAASFHMWGTIVEIAHIQKL